MAAIGLGTIKKGRNLIVEIGSASIENTLYLQICDCIGDRRWPNHELVSADQVFKYLISEKMIIIESDVTELSDRTDYQNFP